MLPLIAAAAFALTGDSPFILCGGGNETVSVSLAQVDVLADAYRVLGHPPVTLTDLPLAGSLPEGTTLVVLGSTTACPSLRALVPAACFSGWEAHCVVASNVSGYAAVVATGVGARGAIFAAYTFSEQVLGVNPWHRLVDDAPQWAGGAVEVNASLAVVVGPPLYRYRAVFFNDEDLLSGLRRDPLAKNAFDAATYNMLYETVLRLKGNAAIVASNPFPDEDCVALAARRGLVVTHQHYNNLGINTYAWPLGIEDWNYRVNAGAMSMAWQSSIAAQADKEVLWTVGLRGLGDYAYPCTNASDCGSQISDVLGNQSAWVQAAQPGAPMILFLWDELLGYLADGHLRIPPGVSVVFTDAGDGYIRVNANVTRWASGAYYHTMMLDGFANQLSELVPVDRIISQVGNFSAHANDTLVFILNLSDMLPVPMSSQAVLQMAWDPRPLSAGGDPLASALAYYTAWGERQFALSPVNAGVYAAMWDAYFKVPYIQGGIGDQFFARVLRNRAGRAVADVQKNGTVSATIAALSASDLAMIGGVDAAAPVEALLAEAQAFSTSGALPPRRAPFFSAHTVLQFGTHAVAARALALLSSALNMSAAGDNAGAADALQTALQRFEALFALRRAAEYAPWHGLYAHDHLADFNLARRFLLALHSALTLPRGAPLLPTGNMVGYEDIDGYQDSAITTSYPRIHANASWCLLTFVRVNCVAAHVAAGTCASSPTGGGFRAGAGAAVTMQVENNAIIRYTADGTAPSISSPAYEGSIGLDAFGAPEVTLRAAAFAGGTAMQETRAVFVRW